jgi:hypothetical protein
MSENLNFLLVVLTADKNRPQRVRLDSKIFGTQVGVVQHFFGAAIKNHASRV